jgi:hypothetical protein
MIGNKTGLVNSFCILICSILCFCHIEDFGDKFEIKKWNDNVKMFSFYVILSINSLLQLKCSLLITDLS